MTHLFCKCTGGSDYTQTTSDLTFDAGTSRACAEIPIVDDNLSESPEVFTVSVVPDGDPGVIVTPATANVTITDNDGMCFQYHR